MVLCVVACGAVPAWANNPPQPDGLLSVLLIFPVAILGFRLAGVAYREGERKRWWLRGLFFALVVLFLAAGTEIAIFPLLIMVFYGCGRACQIITRGSGRKRLLAGGFVMVWTVFAIGDYFVSLTFRSDASSNEATAVGALRTLATAESECAKAAPAQKGGPVYCTLDGLVKSNLISRNDWNVRHGYRYALSLSDGGKKYFVSAVPVVYGDRHHISVIPGASWLRSLGIYKPSATGGRSFAVDESEVIREKEGPTSQSPGREEAEKWHVLGD